MTDNHHLMQQALNYQFDATQHEPDQGGMPVLPSGTYKARIKDTDVQPAGEGIALILSFEVTEGPYVGSVLKKWYNYIHPNPDTSRIAHSQLSAVGHVTGIYKFSMQDKAAALRNANLQIVLGLEPVKAADGSFSGAERNKFIGYLDMSGNKPGKRGASGAAPAQPAAPQNFGGQPAAPQQFAQAPAQFPAFAQPQQQAPVQQQQAPAGFGVQQGFTPPAFNQAPAAPQAQPQQPAWGGQPQGAIPQAPQQQVAQPPFQQQQQPAAPAGVAPWGAAA